MTVTAAGSDAASSDAAGFDAAGFDLDAKYRVIEGGILITGVQALARVLYDQIRADRRQGLNTAAFVSGYPGSPLGGFDQTLQRSGALLGEHNIAWVPGVNEDLAATAVWGSQQDNLAPLSRHDGVIGMWYGKAPGVDRCGDVFRHANLHGTGTNGGVVCAVGDDPASKSSTLPGASEVALYDAGIPVLAPGTPQEVLDLGRHSFELSRYTGCWAGLKIVTAVADGFGSANVAVERITVRRPELSFDGQPWVFTQRPRFFLPDTLELEAELYERRHEAALAYAEANQLNVLEVDPPDPWLTIISSGRTYREVRQALADLGLASDTDVRGAGLRLVRLGMIYPLEPGVVRAAARGVQEILVVEEKRPFVERFVREQLYDAAERPRVLGKRDENGRPLVPVDGELSADRLRPILARRLAKRLAGLVPADRAAAAASPVSLTSPSPAPVSLTSPSPAPPSLTSPSPAPPSLNPAAPAQRRVIPLEIVPAGAGRTAGFCSGCPHNRSTVSSSGSPVGAGVGCHAMVMWLDRGAVTYSQMGGEGAQWLGRAPFTDVPHYVQNVGDGTFFHSGSLAVRAAVSAGACITFKILYNGVVAMTGGQDPAGQLDIPRLCQAMAAEGVAKIIVVSEDPSKYGRKARLPGGTRVWDRDRLAEAEQVLAKVPGVTVLVYDQACAAELRRLRKRGRAPERTQRVVINEAVCEGCGDCGVKSNCLSVRPVDTELGRKTQIDQSSCNTDYSCLDGDCPSFVTVQAPPASAGQPRRVPDLPGDLPEPEGKAVIGGPGGYGIVATGIGGTGVVMLNQVLATAAFLDGLEVRGMDQTGLSQKAGPVVGHLRLWPAAAAPSPEASSAVGEESADLLLALDVLVAAESRHLVRMTADRTATVASVSLVPTAGMVRGATAAPDTAPLLDALRDRSKPGAFTTLDTAALAMALFGDSITANLIALGAAYQAGLLPLAAESISRAIELNGVAVERNQVAFRAGRLAVHDPGRLPVSRRPGELTRRPDPAHLATARQLAGYRAITGPFAELATRRAAELVAYQNAALAGRYLDLVAATARAEADRAGAAGPLTDAVVDAYFKLLAYKDEYEVGRLHLLPEFEAALAAAVPGGRGIRYQLHPPVLRSLGMDKKLAIPAPVARPAFRVLRAMRHLRGTAADPFGYTGVRRAERRLAAEYDAGIRAVLPQLSGKNHAGLTELARLPLAIRGYEKIKLAAVARYEADWQRLLITLDGRGSHG